MLEKILYNARTTVTDAVNRILRWVVAAPNSELPWFVLLRVFPVLVLRNTRRGGRRGQGAPNAVIRRVHMFNDFD